MAPSPGTSTFCALEADSSVLVIRDGFVLGISPGAKVRFLEWKRGNVMPFVAGGYSLLVMQFFCGRLPRLEHRRGHDYALSDTRGIRVEVRDSIGRDDSPSHFVSVRVGLTFR